MLNSFVLGFELVEARLERFHASEGIVEPERGFRASQEQIPVAAENTGDPAKDFLLNGVVKIHDDVPQENQIPGWHRGPRPGKIDLRERNHAAELIIQLPIPA